MFLILGKLICLLLSASFYFHSVVFCGGGCVHLCLFTHMYRITEISCCPSTCTVLQPREIDSITVSFLMNRVFEFLCAVIVSFLLQSVYFFSIFFRLSGNCNLILALSFCQDNVCKSTGHACCKATSGTARTVRSQFTGLHLCLVLILQLSINHFCHIFLGFDVFNTIRMEMEKRQH